MRFLPIINSADVFIVNFDVSHLFLLAQSLHQGLKLRGIIIIMIGFLSSLRIVASERATDFIYVLT